MRWPRRRDDPLIGGHPIVSLVPPIEFVEMETCDLAIIDVSQSSAGESHVQAPAETLQLDEGDEGKKPRKIRRADVATTRNVAALPPLIPIIANLPLLRDDQLSPESPIC